MPHRTDKSTTDLFWNNRAKTTNFEQANIDDLVQRSIENDFMLGELNSGMTVLEVGCGNGFLTQDIRQKVSRVSSFDYSEEMITVAKEVVGEENNIFFAGSVLDPNVVNERFDAVLCVRVLINLNSTEEQKQSIENMASWVKPGGRLILVEGYKDGFDSLSKLRAQTGLSPLEPAKINFYSELETLRSTVDQYFNVTNEWNSGFYDVMTRVGYPLLAGEENVSGPSGFHADVQPLLRALNGSVFPEYARLHGISAIRNETAL